MNKSRPRKYKTAPLIDVPQVDWPGLVTSLVRVGYPKRQLAAAANCSRETIYSILRGVTPDWRVGTALINLHRKVAEGLV